MRKIWLIAGVVAILGIYLWSGDDDHTVKEVKVKPPSQGRAEIVPGPSPFQVKQTQPDLGIGTTGNERQWYGSMRYQSRNDGSGRMGLPYGSHQAPTGYPVFPETTDYRSAPAASDYEIPGGQRYYQTAPLQPSYTVPGSEIGGRSHRGYPQQSQTMGSTADPWQGGGFSFRPLEEEKKDNRGQSWTSSVQPSWADLGAIQTNPPAYGNWNRPYAEGQQAYPPQGLGYKFKPRDPREGVKRWTGNYRQMPETRISRPTVPGEPRRPGFAPPPANQIRPYSGNPPLWANSAPLY